MRAHAQLSCSVAYSVAHSFTFSLAYSLTDYAIAYSLTDARADGLADGARHGRYNIGSPRMRARLRRSVLLPVRVRARTCRSWSARVRTLSGVLAGTDCACAGAACMRVHGLARLPTASDTLG